MLPSIQEKFDIGKPDLAARRGTEDVTERAPYYAPAPQQDKPNRGPKQGARLGYKPQSVRYNGRRSLQFAHTNSHRASANLLPAMIRPTWLICVLFVVGRFGAGAWAAEPAVVDARGVDEA